MDIPRTPQEIARNAFCSTVALEVELANGGRYTVGSGFFIEKDLIATNLHVVQGILGNCYAKLVNQTSEYLVNGYTQIDVEHDLVILKVSGIDAPKLGLSNSDDTQVGDTIYAVGNPRSLKGTFSNGIISGIRSDAVGKLLQMTAPTSQGSSGGPVLNSKGEVIGVSFASFRDGQNLNFAIPSNDLSLLLSKPTDLKPLFLTKFEGVTWVANPQCIWTGTATYTFRLQNKHRWDIQNVHCLVVFYDELKRHTGLDIVEISDPISATTIKDVTRQSIFDVPHLKNLNLSKYDIATQIAYLISKVIEVGQNPSDYNIVDPTAKRPDGSYEVRIIDYELLT